MTLKLLDLFCCAGGAGKGYADAGFEVYGIDINKQKRYPFAFYRGDALEALKILLSGGTITFTKNGVESVLSLSDFDAIHASPPCQAYSVTKVTHTNIHPELVEPTRILLKQSGLPYVIENVPGAPLVNPLILCGTQFGLVAEDVDGVKLALRRHRLFESNWAIQPSKGCAHDKTQVAGAYGGSRHRTPQHRDHPDRIGGYVPAVSVRKKLLGIEWMTGLELNQAIPPVYTKFIGDQLVNLLQR